MATKIQQFLTAFVLIGENLSGLIAKPHGNILENWKNSLAIGFVFQIWAQSVQSVLRKSRLNKKEEKTKI